MVNEDVNRQVIALSIKAAKLTSEVLKDAMKKYLDHRKENKANYHGKMKLKDLVGQGQGATSIEINEGNIKDFQKVAKKYHIDFAVKKDKTEKPPRYLVFFKAKDTDVLTQAFKEYVHKNEKKKDKVSVKKKLSHYKEVVKKDKERARQRDRSKKKTRDECR